MEHLLRAAAATENKPISMSAKEWTRCTACSFPKGTDPNATFNVKADRTAHGSGDAEPQADTRG